MPTVQSTEAQRNHDILTTFLEMVQIDSPSGGEEHMRAYLISRLEQWKAYCPELTWVTDPAGNLIADLPGYQAQHQQRLVISGHMDVVPPCIGIQPVVTTDEHGIQWVHAGGDTVLGADDKSALAVIVEVLEAELITPRLPRPKIRLIFTVEEETKLTGAKKLDAEHLIDAGFSIIFDHTGPQGTLIVQAPSYIEFSITLHGKSVHAGIMPEKGVNTIVILSKVLEQLGWGKQGGRLDAQTTANVTRIQGGKATNIVPDHVLAQGEIRGHDPDRLEALVQTLETTLKRVTDDTPGSDYQLQTEEAFRAFRIDASHPALRLLEQAATQAGLTPQRIVSNGGSDNNIFVNRGLPGVVLSASYVDPHATTERVSMDELRKCANFLTAILEHFATHDFTA